MLLKAATQGMLPCIMISYVERFFIEWVFYVVCCL